MKTRKLTTAAILTSLALVLSYMERFFPLELLIPLPGIKLGLANTVTLFALYALDLKSAALILFLRCVMGSMFGGSVTGLAFSLAGGMLSMFTMAVARHSKWLSVYGVSVLGASAHSCGQIIVAALLMRTRYVFSYLPYLLLTSLACGLLTAALAAGVLRATSKMSFKSGNSGEA